LAKTTTTTTTAVVPYPLSQVKEATTTKILPALLRKMVNILPPPTLHHKITPLTKTNNDLPNNNNSTLHTSAPAQVQVPNLLPRIEDRWSLLRRLQRTPEEEE
jgi:hypothetical protein